MAYRFNGAALALGAVLLGAGGCDPDSGSSGHAPDNCDKPAGCDAPFIAPAWEKRFGGVGAQMARDLGIGPDGTLAVTGNFDGEIDLGGGPLASSGMHDIFLATYSQDGLHHGSAAFGGAGMDDLAFVEIDAHGDVYLLASFEQTIDFGGGALTSAGGADVALAKLTSAGKLEWAVSFGGASGESPGQLVIGADGTIYVAGRFSGSASFGGAGVTAAGGSDAFLASFAPTGDLRWVKALGGEGDDGANGAGVDAEGNVYVVGDFEGEVDLGGAALATSAGVSDIFVASFGADGAARWAKSFGSQGPDIAIDLAARGDRVVVTGGASSGLSVDGVVVSIKDTLAKQGFVIAFETDGEVAWVQAFGSEGANLGQSLAIADDGAVVVGGEVFEGSAFGGAPEVGGGIRNPFVAVLEPDGAPRWTQMLSSSTYAVATGVAAAPSGFAYFAGFFADKLDVGAQTLSSAGGEDVVLLRIAPP